ncbi:MAG: TonB-dependent receptor [Myxococcaceae bacterium]|nr:TonB-dependent receptor [Myxococcaceae bacterium]
MARSSRALFTCLVSLLPLVALAQDGATLTGVVTDVVSGAPVPEVVVTVSSAALDQPRTTKTDADGFYRLTQLPPGAYRLNFQKPSFRPLTRGEAVLRLDTTLRLSVQLHPDGKLAEEVLPVGPPPGVDVASPQQGLSVTGGFLERVPLLTPSVTGLRTFEDLARAAPQASVDRFGSGFNGSQATENLYLVDGLQVNDPLTGALRSGVGLGGVQLPLEFLEEVNVATGGLSPAFGRGTGGLVNVVTKSGSNTTRGSVWGSWWPGVFTAAGQPLRTQGSSLAFDARRHNTGDFGADLGGAIIKDRLWLYGGVAQGVDRQRVTRTVNRFLLTDDGQDFLYDDSGNIRSERLAQASRFDDRRAFTWLGKLTLRMAPTQTLSLSVFGSDQQRTAPAFEALSPSGALTTTDTTSAVLRYAGRFLDERILVDATVGWNRTEQARLPADGSRLGSTTGAAGAPQTTFRSERPLSLREFETLPPEVADLCEPAGFVATRRVTFRDTSRFVMACPVTGSGAAYTFGGPGLLESSQADRLQGRGSVAFLFRALGHHVARAGVDVDWTQARSTRALSGGVALTGTGPVDSPLDAESNARLIGPDALVPLVAARSSASQLSTGAFLQDSWSLLDAVTVNAGLRYDSQQLFDAAGRLGLALNHVLSPRVGFVYDFTNQGRSRLFGNYAVYQQALPLALADRALNGAPTVRTRTSCDPVGDPANARVACTDEANALPLSSDPLAPSPDTVRLAAGRSVVDPSLRPMTKGELTAGLEYEVFANLRVGLIGTHSWLFNAVEDTSADEGATRFLGNPGSGLASGLPRADRRFFAGTLFVSRAFSDGWLVQSSYTLSSLSGNYAGFIRPETGQVAPGFTQAFDTQSVTANQAGALPADQTHLIRAYVAKDFEVTSDVTVLAGLGYEGSSGRPISYLAQHPLVGLDATSVLPRGSGGRTPWLHTVHARAGVLWKLGSSQSMQVTLDVFNLFNVQEAVEVSERFSTAAVTPANLPPGADPQEAACLSGNNPTCVTALQKQTGQGLSPVSAADLNPNFKQPTLYQQPLSVRLGVKLSF